MYNIQKGYYNSPVGMLEIFGSDNGISMIYFLDRPKEIDSSIETPAVLKECINQLDEYFHGHRQQFDIQVDLQGTEFQKQVWLELMNIPFGKTASYHEIAQRIGSPNASRAVGLTNNRNKIPIIIPCHRVIGADGKLVGYGGGLWRKEWLLKMEGAIK
jgi:methylated-DNA-[protein]-cysteine S-methyltransferase